jgi:hypothetical protein
MPHIEALSPIHICEKGKDSFADARPAPNLPHCECGVRGYK